MPELVTVNVKEGEEGSQEKPPPAAVDEAPASRAVVGIIW